MYYFFLQAIILNDKPLCCLRCGCQFSKDSFPRSSEWRIKVAGFSDTMVATNQATLCHSPEDHIRSFHNRKQFISRTIIVTIMSLSLLILRPRRTGLVVLTCTDRQEPTTVPRLVRHVQVTSHAVYQAAVQTNSFICFCDSHKSFLIP